MNKILVSAALAATTLLAAPAAAQSSSGIGGHVQFLVGYDRLEVDLEDLGVDDSVHDDGVVYGIGGGIDFGATGGTRFGVDVEVSDSRIKEGDAEEGRISVGRDLYVGGRVLFPFQGSGSVYVKAGYTNLRFSAEVDGEGESANADGWRVGAGAQIPIRENAYIGGEYRYSNYEADISRHQLVATLGWRF